MYLLIGYFVGAITTEVIYMDLQLTNWTNIFTYAVIVFWPWVVAFYLAIPFAIIVLLSFFIFTLRRNKNDTTGNF